MTHRCIRRRGGPIAEITKAYIRHYTDSGQTTAYVEWINHKGTPNRTEGEALWIRDDLDAQHAPIGEHMRALFARAQRNGIAVTREIW